MEFDVFVSYSVRDMNVAENVCSNLESSNIKCWIAPRDIEPGANWGESIIDAIENSKLMVLIFSADSDKSPQVLREVERAVSRGIPIIPFQIEDVEPSAPMDGFLSGENRLEAHTPPLETHIRKLTNQVKILLKKEKSKKKLVLTAILKYTTGFLGIFLLLGFISSIYQIMQGDGGFYTILSMIILLVVGLIAFLLAFMPNFLANKVITRVNIRKMYNMLTICLIILSLLLVVVINDYVPTEYSNQGIFFIMPSNLSLYSQNNETVNIGEAHKFYMGMSTDPMVMLNITITPLHGEVLEDVYYKKYLDYKNFQWYVSVSDSNLTVDGENALQKVYEITIDGQRYKKREVWLEKNGKLYLLKFTAPIETYDKHQPDLDTIINSFHVK
ncbi:MAG: toll/interleukin-1 receptor domain-containing protein [Methanobacterium sp.]|uniref:TIR domain-containing protein n=1 Tax=Methanobacterium sp. TaxID=2164 RepID=UPI003D65C960|nr:toll/interleukin-1 receptor domain-containing protein [Methanobacterium sp.]